MRALLLARFAAAVLAMATVLGAGAFGGDAQERWFELSLDGVRCGALEVHRDRSDDRITTRTRLTMRLARGATSVEVAMATVVVESERGEPIEATVDRTTGAERIRATYRFERMEEGGWRVAIDERGRVREERLADDGWFSPAAAERFVAARLAAGAKEIVYRSVDFESGLRIGTTTMTRIGEERTRIVGAAGKDDAREIPVSVWTVRNAAPMPSRELYASDGELVESSLPLGIGELRSRRSTRERAMAPIGAPAEIMVRSFVPAAKPIRGAREKTRLELVVRGRGGELPDLPSSGAQRVRRVDAGEAIVTVDAERGSPAIEGDAVDPRYLAATALIDHDAPAIRELLAQALARTDPSQPLSGRDRAETLRRFVARWITRKDLGSAFASASEAGRTRAGDCTEHAVLLAALLRADGTPSRVAAGLVYADRFAGERDVWGWHMWTQALLPSESGALEWLDFDATLPTRFDAAHLLTSVGDLSGGATDPMWLEALALIGNISIDVREAAADEASPLRRVR